MKSLAASQSTLRHLLSDAQLILLSDVPDNAKPSPVDYDGNRPVPVSDWSFTGSRATNADQIDLPRNTGRTTARVSAWAIISTDGNWLYSNRFPESFDVRPGDEPYLVAGDIVIED